MAFVIADRVRETSTTTGTGNFTLAGAVTGYQTFDAALDTGDTTYYAIADQGGANWEVGIGTFTSPSTLARTTILSSSNGGSVVTFGAGTKDVFISLPASKTVQSFSAGSTGLTPSTASFGAVALAGTLVAANGGTGQSSYTIGDLLYASGATALSKLADIATGNALISGGVATAPSWGKIGLTTHVSGTLPVTNGGTGTATAFTAGSVVFAGASGVYAQDNTNLFFDDTNNRLGIGTASPDAALTVNTVASFGAGAAALPSIAAKGDLNTGMWFPAADTIAASTGGSERLRIDSSGNVGIGTSSPGRRLDVQQASADYQLRLGDAGGNYYDIGRNTTNGLLTFYGNQAVASGYVFSTVNGERARIDSNGNFMVGTTSSTVAAKNAKVTAYQTANSPAITSYVNATTPANQIIFVNPNGEVGNINTSGTTTSYGTSSDYRLKHDIQPMLSGLSTISALKPSTYKWNADNSYGEGFIAHELQAVIPQAVSGEKDAVNENGSIKAQGVDYSKIVVHLVAAIQELKADFDAYKAAHP